MLKQMRFSALILLVIPLALLVGCGQSSVPNNKIAIEIPPLSDEPGEVELMEATVTRDKPDLVNFEVKYRFKKGKPDKYYLVEIRFPGTKNFGNKPIESWQLKPEGSFKDGLYLTQQEGVKEIEFVMSESTNPMAGYTKNSNVLKTTIKQ